jgi:hypothetical protein
LFFNRYRRIEYTRLQAMTIAPDAWRIGSDIEFRDAATKVDGNIQFRWKR